ncbi:hypothetical protein LUZ61_014929 [Rhynchospora tenuis]|uniref:Uncharacterized protein n=1 Tax=Rhynchospora tenuis TaxID=198213 RepID=A0AAD5WBM8_9POAL|nr:hypothetical protein LUZ61_014929 [Rhynchospora tenuis]
MSSVTFAFSASPVRQCLAYLQFSNLSPFDALASLLWLQISSYKDASLGPAQLTLALDCRRLESGSIKAELTCLAWDDVPVYNAQFSAGATRVYVGYRVGNAQGEGLVVIMAGAPGDREEAQTVTVTLPTDLTAKIYRDEAILKYGPRIMFSLKYIYR